MAVLQDWAGATQVAAFSDRGASESFINSQNAGVFSVSTPPVRW